MPLLGPDAGTHSFPVVQLPDMPDFNEEGQYTYVIENFDDWWDTPPPRAVLVPNGGGAGAVPSGDWLHVEQYLNLSGWVVCPPEAQEAIRQALLLAIPTTSTVQLNYLGRGWDEDKCIFVRRYDKAQFNKSADRIRFTLPLVAPDPNKYGFPAQVGSVGVYSGTNWYEIYTNSSGWGEVFGNTGGWGEVFSQSVAPGPYVSSLDLSSSGSISSRRLTIDVVGPLTAGGWKLSQETAGRQMWCNVSLSAGQVLTIDCQREVATLAGSTVPLFGDMFTLEPGTNTFRLISSASNTTAYATITAYPAFM